MKERGLRNREVRGSQAGMSGICGGFVIEAGMSGICGGFVIVINLEASVLYVNSLFSLYLGH